jgi:EamA domain-containing membrane protein RarD
MLKRRTFTPPKTKEALRRQRLLRVERYALIAAAPAVIIACVRLSATPLVGEITIGVYGLGALILRIPGRVSFWLASIALVSIGIEFLLFPQTNRPNNTALFVFLLLAVGFVSLALETRRMDVRGKRFRRR